MGLYMSSAKRFFQNPCFARDGELHTFLRCRSGEEHRIYYVSGADVSQRRTLEETWEDEKAFLDFVRKETGRGEAEQHDFFLKRTDERRSVVGVAYSLVWVFVCDCLEEGDLRVGASCFFGAMAKGFDRYLDLAEGEVRRTAREKARSGTKGISGRALETSSAEAIPAGKDEAFAKEMAAEVNPAEVDALLLDVEIGIQNMIESLAAPFNLDMLDILSGEYYEKAEHESRMAFLPQGLSAELSKKGIQFPLPSTSFCADKARELRKLLEMTDNSLWLVFGESAGTFRVLGLCDKESIPLPCLSARIRRHMEWDLFWRGLNKGISDERGLDERDAYIISGRNGKYMINRPLKKAYLKRRFGAYFGKTDAACEKLADAVLEAARQSHGTMIAVLEPDAARKEAERLCGKNYGFSAVTGGGQAEILTRLTAIDGGIIMDTDGELCAVGVIFDGMVGLKGPQGDMSRGARYNSAKKYVESCPSKTGGQRKVVALVVSEDGPIDILGSGTDP